MLRANELRRRIHSAQQQIFEQPRPRLQALNLNLQRGFQTNWQRLEHRRQVLLQGLEARSPLKILQRGYSLITGKDGRPVREATQVQVGDSLRARLAKGELQLAVETVSKEA